MRVYVYHLSAALSRLDDKSEADRVGLGHVRAHYQHAVAILKVLLEGSRGSSSVGGAQTGHRCAVSYSCLVFDRDNSGGIEELFDEIVLFVI